MPLSGIRSTAAAYTSEKRGESIEKLYSLLFQLSVRKKLFKDQSAQAIFPEGVKTVPFRRATSPEEQ